MASTAPVLRAEREAPAQNRFDADGT